MLLVFKKPFRYAVAGYGVFNCVNGGVIKKREMLKPVILECKNNYSLVRVRKDLIV